MKKTLLFVAFATLLFTWSCDRSSNDIVEPGSGTEIKINATAFNRWVYFSFAQGDTVGTGATTVEDDAYWKARSDWDIAFHRNNLRTNGGVSGNGRGGAIDAQSIDFDAITTAPKTGYMADSDVQIMVEMSMDPAKMYFTCGGNTIMNTWTTTAGTTITPDPKIFFVRTASGKFAKVFMKAYKDGTTNGKLTIEYYYQPNGSHDLATCPE